MLIERMRMRRPPKAGLIEPCQPSPAAATDPADRGRRAPARSESATLCRRATMDGAMPFVDIGDLPPPWLFGVSALVDPISQLAMYVLPGGIGERAGSG
jgi:hypothetical protein